MPRTIGSLSSGEPIKLFQDSDRWVQSWDNLKASSEIEITPPLGFEISSPGVYFPEVEIHRFPGPNMVSVRVEVSGLETESVDIRVSPKGKGICWMGKPLTLFGPTVVRVFLTASTCAVCPKVICRMLGLL